jgi:hypothetical protein
MRRARADGRRWVDAADTSRDDNSGMGTRPDEYGTGMIFYPWVARVPDPN